MASQKMQMVRRERRSFSASEDSAVMKQVMATHSPDGRDIEVKPILLLVEDILQRATPTVVEAQQTQFDDVENKAQRAVLVGMLEVLAYTIHRVACEISCKCSGGGDAHATTMALFNTLGSYSWDAKVVLALSAFAMSYGEFWLTAQLYTINPLAKSIALLKQLPEIFEHTDSLKPRFDAVNTLIKAMLDVTKCIIELKELPTDYISPDTPALKMAIAHIPTAVYWTIRSVVACSSQIISLIGMSHEHISSTSEAWELSSLAHKVNNIHGHLTKQLSLCGQHIDENRHIEAYQRMIHYFETTHVDNMKVLKYLINPKDEMPLVDGVTKKRVSIEVLRRKIVILFISDLELNHDKITVLAHIYTQHGKSERPYEVVWLPVIDRSVQWTKAKEASFTQFSSSMPWHSVHHPLLIEPAVIRYIKEVWHFEKTPLLVVLDAQGKVVSPNALHMMWIWGSQAFPFTSSREEALWKEQTAWRVEFLVDDVDHTLLQWVIEGKYVCLYGGEDIEWIRRFTTAMKRVTKEANISLQMIYAGKSNPKERIKKVIKTIIDENLSDRWHDLSSIWHFWVRLESMWYSKIQQGRTVENDSIMQEVMTMLAFDASADGWAMVSKGSTEMVKSNGKKMVECLLQFDSWKQNIQQEGFVKALESALAPYHTHEHCTQLILPGTAGRMQEKVVCAECKRPMEKYVLYRCCKDD